MQIRKLATGDRLLDYRILEKIGEGGFGEVFRAEHEVLGRIVAIKVPRDLEALSALRLEGVIQASLDHPAIVKTLEISMSHDPPYVVMEHVDGMSLAEMIKREGPLSWRRGARVLLETGRALKHAHERGVVHGDMKPGNVLVEPGENGRVRITDFGLGRVFEGPKGNMQISRSLELASSGPEVQGTLRYLAPEVQRGEPADERSDIYSWGVLLFETLTGKLPEGREVPSELAPGTPPELDRIFEACFQRREKRPRSLDSSLVALERLLTAGPKQKGGASQGDDEDGRSSRAIPLRGHDASVLVQPIGTVVPPRPTPRPESEAQRLLDDLKRIRGLTPGPTPPPPPPPAAAAVPHATKRDNCGWHPAPASSAPFASVPLNALISGTRELDLGPATKLARSDEGFARWRQAFVASLSARFGTRPAGCGLMPAEGYDLGMGIVTEGDPQHRVYVAVAPFVDLEGARRFVKYSRNVFEREKGVWEKEVTFVLLTRDLREKEQVLWTLRSFSTGWWRRRRVVLYDLTAEKIYAMELGCDPRGNALKRLFFEAVRDASLKTEAAAPAWQQKSRRECVRSGFVGVALALLATTGLLVGAMSIEKSAQRRWHRGHYGWQRPTEDGANMRGPDGSSSMAAPQARPALAPPLAAEAPELKTPAADEPIVPRLAVPQAPAAPTLKPQAPAKPEAPAKADESAGDTDNSWWELPGVAPKPNGTQAKIRFY